MPEASGDMRILVVDDDLDVVGATANVLRREGYVVTTLSPCREAIERLASEAFDVLLTDFDMPEPNGLDLAKAARASGKGIKIVVVTGNLGKLPLPHRAIDLALEKPIDPRPLVAFIEKMRRQVAPTTPPPSSDRAVAGASTARRPR